MENNIIIPKGWVEIRTEQYIELLSLDNTDYNSMSVYNLEVLSIISDTDKDDDVWQDMDIDDLFVIYNNTKWLLNEPNKKHLKEIDNKELKDFNTLTLGEFIDIQYFFNDNYISNIHLICAILFKQYKLDEWNNKIYEPYEYNIYERSNTYLEIPITNIYGIISNYLEWKDNFMTSYTNLFEVEANITEEEMYEGLDQNEIDELNAELEADKQLSKWNWERILYDLSGGNITKFNDILNMNIILVFNILSMKKELKL